MEGEGEAEGGAKLEASGGWGGGTGGPRAELTLSPPPRPLVPGVCLVEAGSIPIPSPPQPRPQLHSDSGNTHIRPPGTGEGVCLCLCPCPPGPLLLGLQQLSGEVGRWGLLNPDLLEPWWGGPRAPLSLA